MKSDISLKQLNNDIINSNYKKTFDDFLIGKELEYKDYVKIVSIGILLLDSNNFNVRKLGYHLLVNYALKEKDFKLLDEVSCELFNMPIMNIIRKNELINEDYFNSLINEVLVEQSKIDASDISYTYEQINMISSFLENKNNYVIVAPTSFGKSELINKYVLENYNKKNICIVVPTKALINQTRNSLFHLFSSFTNKPKIITHQDVEPSIERDNIYVLTQERLYSAIFENKINIVFDTLLLDEAHNIFEDSERARLLSKIIIYLYKKNKKFCVKYFSPIIRDKNNLAHKYLEQETLDGMISNPILKTEKIYLCDFVANEYSYYDRFFDEYISLDSNLLGSDYYSFIKNNSSDKNIIYFNSPKEIKIEVINFTKKLDFVNDKQIDKMITQISNYVHKDYDLLDCLKKGVVYHCGIMPDNVRIYLENCVKKIKSIQYVFCTSTLLEGVNMPFTSMFICDCKKGTSKLSYHQLINLIGRVNRYSTIFSGSINGLKGIISNVYFVGFKKRNYDLKKFIKDNLKIESNSSTRNDQVENPFLSNSNINIIEEKSLSAIINEPLNGKIAKMDTEIGRLMLDQNIQDFDIFEYEHIIEEKLSRNYIDYSVIELIYDIFIDGIPIIDQSKLMILKNDGARKHYDYILNLKKKNNSFAQMIIDQISYWENQKNTDIYVGTHWGTPQEKGPASPFIDKNSLSRKDMVNLAIIKVKEDLDFIDYNLIKYIEILYQTEKIDETEYNLIKYGTSDIMQIYFIKEGLSYDLSRIIVNNYSEYIINNNETYILNPKIKDAFKKENAILLHELEYYIN